MVAYEFTARMEDRLDEVEEGKAPWPKVVWEFYELPGGARPGAQEDLP